MKHRRLPLVAAGLAVSATAHAQSSITLYGSLDLGPVYVSNVGGQNAKRLSGGTTQPDRMGFRGIEDLGGGTYANFLLEMGIAPDVGTQISPTRFFNREARVSLSSNTWGAVALGHTADVMFDYVGRYSNGYNLFNFNAFHPGNFDGLANTAAFDNAIKYYTPRLAGAQAELEVAAGEGGGRSSAAGLDYANGPFRAALAYVHRNLQSIDIAGRVGIRNTLGRTLVPGTAVTLDHVTTLGAGLGYNFGALSLNAAYTRTRFDLGPNQATPRSADLGATYRFTEISWLNLGVSNSRFDAVHWNTYSVEELYWLSKRTQVYAQATVQRAGGPGAIAAQNGVGLSSNGRQNVYGVSVHHSF